ncbi:hypothetical protein QA601_04780 [Chitinispirillales bacterium ANBcel5]|uniref:hypothetical protein n=1 Tax=Cellulosispirillum alkaliphilum TaxID=3039283 RepID=UPI002A5812AF|nr:hypothetical protein [Chitinispirillales bacterium ANBcel5]
MIRKKFKRFGILFFLTAIFFSCSESNNITDPGRGVIEDFDPELLDVSGLFKTVAFDSTAFCDGFSIPHSSDNNFIHHPNRRNLIIGRSEEQLFKGYVEFAVLPTDTTEGPRYSPDNSLQAVYLHIYADTRHKDTSELFMIPVFSCEPKDLFEEVVLTEAMTEIGKAEITSGSKDSIPLPEDLASALFTALSESAKTDTSVFAFTIADTTDSFKYLQNPFLVMHIADKDGEVFKDSLYGLSQLTVYEKDFDTLSAQPVSRRISNRVAVFEFDIDRFFDTTYTSGTSFDEVLSAEIMMRRPQVKNLPENENISFRAYLGGEYNNAGELSVNFGNRRVFSDSVMSFRFEKDLQEITRSRQSSVFLYLETINEFSQTLWTRPTHFDAVLTTID